MAKNLSNTQVQIISDAVDAYNKATLAYFNIAEELVSKAELSDEYQAGLTKTFSALEDGQNSTIKEISKATEGIVALKAVFDAVSATDTSGTINETGAVASGVFSGKGIM